MFCDTKKFPSLTFCGPHKKPHGVRGLSKHYHMRFDKNLGMSHLQYAEYPGIVLNLRLCYKTQDSWFSTTAKTTQA